MHQSAKADNFQNAGRQGLPCRCKVGAEIRRREPAKVKSEFIAGHVGTCRNPCLAQQHFILIFVLSRCELKSETLAEANAELRLTFTQTAAC